MQDKEVINGFGAAEEEADRDIVNEAGSLTSRMNDSIGLSEQKYRNSEVKELTLS